MVKRHFMELLRAKWGEEGKFVCVGLDTDADLIPEDLAPVGGRMIKFNKGVIEATGDLVCAFKPNIAFYEKEGDMGWSALRETIRFIHEQYPDVPVILDAKRADIGKTNLSYIAAAFEDLEADAITVNPYLGEEALRPFLDREEKGIIVLCRTSNPGAGEFQDMLVDGDPLYLHVARHVAERWNRNGNCGIVVGATCPAELARVREVVPDLPLLIPGIGTQGGDVDATVRAAHRNMIVNSSSAIIFSEDPRAATARLDQEVRRSYCSFARIHGLD